MPKLSRRGLLWATGLVAALAGVAEAPVQAAQPASAKAQRGAPQPYRYFTAPEAAFIEAAVARLIPADELGPGALEAGVPAFIDKQLAGARGSGERLYRSGPWRPGSPSQGYQLPYTPAELFRHALRAIDADLKRRGGHSFARLPAQEQVAYLAALEKGEKDLDGMPSQVFFESLLEMTLEGYFSGPVYGGNKGLGSWEMIGFPGAPANYYDPADRHGQPFARKPMSLGESGAGDVHLQPGLPAHAPPRSK